MEVRDTPRTQTSETWRRLRSESTSLLHHFANPRLLAAMLFLVLGMVVLVVPATLAWIVGLGAIVLGVLLLTDATAR